MTNLTKLKYELNTILTQKAEFSLFCARQKQFEEGDKLGKFLARYIKQKEARTAIPAIKGQGDILMLKSIEINKTFRQFFAQLYSSETQASPQTTNCFLMSLNLPSLSGEQVDRLEAPISQDEI